MNKFTWILLLLTISCSNTDYYRIEELNTGWEFWKEQDSAQIREVFLPHTPRLEPYIVNDQWQGICWYRKVVDIPRGKHVLVRFEGAMNVADLWVNNHYAGRHMGGYLPFVCDITRVMKENGDFSPQAVLKIRLDNNDNPVTGPKPLKLLDFNMYGGLYRNARLIIKSPLHITDPILENTPAGGGVLVTFPVVSQDSALVEVRTHIRYNPLDENQARAQTFILEQTLLAGDSVCACSAQEIVLESGQSHTALDLLRVQQPALWSPEQPFCYDLETRLIKKARGKRTIVIDRERTTVGIRKVVFKGKEMFINGNKTFLRGVNRHQEYPYVGYAAPANAQWRDAEKIREAGFNLVRLSHYPQSPDFMEACNRLGLFVLDAIPGWQYFSGDPAFQAQVIETAHHMIRRDRNHPCVLAWEVSLNESWMSEEFIDRILEASRSEMPVPIYTAGWQEYGYDIFLQARQHRLGHPPTATPGPLIVSEYGDWEYYALNAGFAQQNWENLQPAERSSRQLREHGQKRLLQQVANIDEAHNSNYHVDACADNYWVMFDYNRGYADDLEASGIMSLERLPKFSWHYFRSQRSPLEHPMVFIAHYWDGTDTALVQVQVLSNAEQVGLWLNDKLVERRDPPFTFVVPRFEKGWIKAGAYYAGQLCARDSVHTPSEAVAVEWWLDTGNIPASANDLLFVYAKAVDRQGHPVPSAKGRVLFTLEGQGMWLIGEEPGGSVVQTLRAEAPFRAGIAFALLQLTPLWDGSQPQLTVTMNP
ncbi:MAG: glycoside hydrolase family 2 TIM barrel-domain containing protein [Bacteroidales bacterium]|nr:glycoside hydrolase family 2 TIM barrel-domain containing protein [Bacteroidales bacterium]MDD4030755.1 glycoside hydrolase family 2 TIM barrel-domain containing protein [Bacteroidales bacterium]MDD4435080.1 glycoside hydrolase family 2 TIM barrel-domain containing protein [Bacteroidales bacterium]MDD5732907.1 glycoside hydrolase family 2 TIM barrel-domain containing protein [Bacteroidales bacterium]